MRKRPILFAIAASAAGLAVFGPVLAQSPQPGAYPPPQVVNVPVMTSPPSARPAAEWAPTPTGYGGQPNRPRLTNPVAVGANGVIPANFELPPPNMNILPTPPTGPGGSALAPPSISLDPGESKFVPTPPAATPLPLHAPPPMHPQGTPVMSDPRPPLVPVPPPPIAPGTFGIPPATTAPIVTPTPVPLPAHAGGTSGHVTPPILTPMPATASDNAMSTGSGAIRTYPTMPSLAGLPGKLTQTVTLEAICPESVVFGGEFRYELIVKNAGNVAVGGVRVEDELPAGAKYVGSDPPAEQNGDRLSWAVGALDAGAEKRIAVRVKTTEEGELHSRATVTYAAAVDARTKVTRPRIAVTVTGAEVCKSGEEAIFQVKVTNSGTGPAEKMVLQAKLSEGLIHPGGAVIEAALANLPPGESKTLPLKVTAGKAGAQLCQITVAAQGSQDATAKSMVNVVEPLLQIAQTGPVKCLVRAEPTYEITLSNPGTAATEAVTLYAVLPEGFEYIQASDSGTYNAANRAIVWKLSSLAPGGTKAFSLKLHAATAGDGFLRTIAQAGPEQPAPATIGAGGVPAMRAATRVLEAKIETPIKAEGVAAVRFEVRDLEDPVEVGKEALYEIRVMNQGTGICTNVQLVAALADGTAYTGSSGPTQVKAQGQTLVFDPIPSLPVKGEMVYQVKVRGTAAGDLRFRVQLTCDQVRTPVVKEESTRFYKE